MLVHRLPANAVSAATVFSARSHLAIVRRVASVFNGLLASKWRIHAHSSG